MRRSATRLLRLALLLSLTVSCTHGGGFWNDESSPPPPARGAIPPRPDDAVSGSAFLRSIEGLGVEQRERAILRELRRGNLPDFLRQLKPISLHTKDGTATVWVMPDYLAVGSDADFAYVPMNPITAQRVADHLAFLLPTKRLVDEVYAQAEVRLAPTPLPAGSGMVSIDYYRRHNDTVRGQLGERRGALAAGHKKDLVLTNRLCQQRRRVAIYGWHKEPGKAIQPLSLVHGDLYADYSHGVRLVARTALIDGVPRPVEEVLQDPRLAALLSDEGVLRQTRIATDCTGC